MLAPKIYDHDKRKYPLELRRVHKNCIDRNRCYCEEIVIDIHDSKFKELPKLLQKYHDTWRKIVNKLNVDWIRHDKK